MSSSRLPESPDIPINLGYTLYAADSFSFAPLHAIMPVDAPDSHLEDLARRASGSDFVRRTFVTASVLKWVPNSKPNALPPNNYEWVTVRTFFVPVDSNPFDENTDQRKARDKKTTDMLIASLPPCFVSLARYSINCQYLTDDEVFDNLRHARRFVDEFYNAYAFNIAKAHYENRQAVGACTTEHANRRVTRVIDDEHRL